MNRENERGQTLSLFVLLLPLLIMIGAFLIDISYAKYNKRKLDSINKIAITYGLSNINSDPKDNIINLIKENDKDIKEYNVDVDVEEKSIKISLVKESNSFFGKILKKDLFKEESKYLGYIKDDKFIIERDKKWKKKLQK